VDDGARGESWPAGWYADPWFAGQQRYWDGAAWTPHTRVSASAYAPTWPAAPSRPVEPPAEAVSAEPTVAMPGWGEPTVAIPALGAGVPEDHVAGAGPAGAGAAAPAGADAYAPPWASGGGGGGWLPAPEAGPRGPAPRRSGRWVALGAIVVVVAVAAAAITVASGSGRPRRVASPPPTTNGGGGLANGGGGQSSSPSTSTTIPPAASTDPAARQLNKLDVAPADAPPGYTVGLLDSGNLVAGQVTLDLCNGTYASEALRTARRQVDLDDQAGNTVLSTEAVLYTSPAATAQAFSELKARAANCPQTFLPPPPGEQGNPATKTTFSAPPDASWPSVAGVDRLAYAFTSTDQQGNSLQSIAVYLRHGRAFLGLYFASPGPTTPAIAGKTTVEAIVGVFEQRLAALSSSTVNATVPAPAPLGGI